MSESTPEPPDQPSDTTEPTEEPCSCGEDHPVAVAIHIPECNCDDPTCTINMIRNFRMRVQKDDEGEVYVNFEDLDTMMRQFAALHCFASAKAGAPEAYMQVVMQTTQSLLLNTRIAIDSGRTRDPMTAEDVPDTVEALLGQQSG